MTTNFFTGTPMYTTWVLNPRTGESSMVNTWPTPVQGDPDTEFIKGWKSAKREYGPKLAKGFFIGHIRERINGANWEPMSDRAATRYRYGQPFRAATREYGHRLGAALAHGQWAEVCELVTRPRTTIEAATRVLQGIRAASLESRALDIAFRAADCDGARAGLFRCTSCRNVSADTVVRMGQNHTIRYCQSCVDGGRVVFSRAMDCWLRRSAAVRMRQSRRGDVEWVTTEWAASNDYVRMANVWYPPGVIAPNAHYQDYLYNYHDGPDLQPIPSEYDRRTPRVLLGMELEVEAADAVDRDEDGDPDWGEISGIACDIINRANDIVPGYMKAEHDGSLDNGFEMITAPTGLDVHAKVLSQLIDEHAFSGLASHDTETCGLHVHLCRKDMTSLHEAKLQQFINAPGTEQLIRHVARRYHVNYSKFSNDNWLKRAAQEFAAVMRNQTHYHGRHAAIGELHSDRFKLMASVQGDRYRALNWNHEHTVEFRMFRGTLRFESIMACLEFAFAAWHFTRQAPMHGLTTEAFMEFICRAENRKDTRHLRAYLNTKRFRPFYQAERAVRPKDKRIQLEPSHNAQDNFASRDPRVPDVLIPARATRYTPQQFSDAVASAISTVHI